MFYLKPMVVKEKLMNKYTPTFVFLLLCLVLVLVNWNCTIYPTGITFGGDSCPHFCGVEHKHKTHSVDYDCGQETCIHMLKK